MMRCVMRIASCVSCLLVIGVPAMSLDLQDDINWLPGQSVSGNIAAFAVYGSKLIAAGDFLEIGGVAANRIAAWDGSSWSPLGTGLNGPVTALTVCNGMLIAGGEFTSAGGVPVTNVAAWVGSIWIPLGSINYGGQNGGPVTVLATYNGSPIAASSYYDSHAGKSWALIFRWSGSAWICIGAGIEYGLDNAGRILAMTVYDNKLIVGGFFTTIEGAAVNSLAEWDGSTWSSVGGGGSMWILALKVLGYKLYVGGGFGYLQSWNASEWATFIPDAGDFDAFQAFAGLRDSLFIGGQFSTLGNNICVWDGVARHPLGSGLNGAVGALEAFGNDIFVAGSFTTAGGKPSLNLARWSKQASIAVLISNFEAAPAGNGIELRWAIETDDRIEGFRLYRSRAGEKDERLLNEARIEPDMRSYMDDSAIPGERYVYALAALTAEGREVRSAAVEVECPQIAAQLFQNAPNPFNPSTAIRFTIPTASHVELRVYTPSGELVRTLVEGTLPAGTGEVTWDGTNDAGSSTASGVYFYRLRMGKTTLSRKMLLIR
jgi:hypothetical protein